LLEALAEGIPPEADGMARAAAKDAAIGNLRNQVRKPKGVLRPQQGQRSGSKLKH
jgi:hypothetical protein